MPIPSSKQQDIPYPVPQGTCGNKIKLALEGEKLPILEKDRITLPQSIVGSAFFFGRIIDNAMFVAIN